MPNKCDIIKCSRKVLRRTASQGTVNAVNRKGKGIASMKRIRTIVAVLLVACLMAGSSAAVFAGSFGGYEALDHPPLQASDLQCKGWDDARLKELLSQFEAMDEKTSSEAFLALYQEILDEMDAVYTQYVLADSAYYANVNDEAAAAKSDEMFEARSNADDAFFMSMQKVLHGPKGKTLRTQLRRLWISWIETYVEESEELEGLYSEENRLIQEYYTAISEVPESKQYEKWAKEANERCGPIFVELVQVRDEIARWNGYDNYYEYAFDSYGRDYDPEDIQKLCSVAKEELVPLLLEIYDVWINLDYPRRVERFSNQEEVLDVIGKGIVSVHPDLQEAFDYLRKYKPYDLEYSEAKAATGYTDNLPSFHSAFIFNSPYDDYRDYSDLVHEFGHFNAAYHDPTPSVYMTSVLDVAEIHSQALELLVSNYADDLYGKDAPFMKLDAVFRMVDSVLAGCMYDEFQKTVYENPGMTLEEINQLSEDLAKAYAMDLSGAEYYDWVDVTHTFDLPCYYVSYATSAISSLDLWRQSLSDPQGAADRYMQVSALDSSVTYMDAVKACDLMDFTDQGAVLQLVNDIEHWFKENYDGKNASFFSSHSNPLSDIKDTVTPADAEKVKTVVTSVLQGVLVAIAVLGVLIVSLAVVLWKTHKGDEINNQTPANPGYTEDTSNISSFYEELKPTTQSMSPNEPEEPLYEENPWL